MKITFVALLGLCALAWATPTGQQEHDIGHRYYKVADKQFLQKQKDILRLFRYINQPSYYKDHVEVFKSYNVEGNLDAYTNQQVVKHFLYHYHKGLLPRGEIFSVFNEAQLREAIALFKLFYYAKDYDTFYKTAVWARNHINEGQYVYALSVAIVHRSDTYGIILPPIYEVQPYYFFNTEVIERAHRYKQQSHDQTQQQQQQTGNFNGHTINANYSGFYLNLNEEQSLSYYTEDVGINAYYYYYNIYYPFWLSGEEFHLKNDRRGEQFYYIYQQLLARYYLERLSNGFGEIPHFNYEVPLEHGYCPSLRYPNGLEFPTRPNHAKLYEYFYNYGQKWSFKSKYGYSYTYVQDYERRIRDVIDAGYVNTKDGKRVDLYTPDGFEVLGDLIESNPDSPNNRYYGPLQTFARHLLGYSYQPYDNHHIAPSALEHFETSLRDPVFYQFYKRIVLYFQKYKTNLVPYTYNELYYPGVKIESVQFDRLVTYFDYFYSDLSNALYVTEQEYETDNYQVRVRQQRLNHKPYTYRINYVAEQAGDAVVRVYLGPKHDEYGRRININENRINFVEIDQFKVAVQVGKNVIERNSRQTYYSTDRTSYRELFNRVVAAISGEQEFKLDGSEAYYAYPQRYLLPQGTPSGQTFQIYVIINPYKVAPAKQQDQNYYYPRVGTGGNYIDALPFGYPFDRHIDEYNFHVPNSHFQDVVVYHKNVEDINASVQNDNESQV